MQAAGQHPRVPERPPAQAAPGEGPAGPRGRVGTARQPRHRRPDAAVGAAAADERCRRGGRHFAAGIRGRQIFRGNYL